MKKFTKEEKALHKLHEDIRKDKEKQEEKEWIRMQTTGGGAET